MHIIIVGCGKVGELLTAYISREGHDVTVIDTDPQVIEDAVNEYDVIGLAGNGASNAVLIEAGAKDADLVIAVTASDELNIIVLSRREKARHASHDSAGQESGVFGADDLYAL